MKGVANFDTPLSEEEEYQSTAWNESMKWLIKNKDEFLKYEKLIKKI